MLRPVSTLCISQESVNILIKHGYNFLEDILENKESHKFLTQKELKIISRIPETVESINLFTKLHKREKILVPCKNLNKVLDGGFECETIIELCGASGTGKSQICFQASVAVQLKKIYGGLNGKVVYIDTRNGFSPLRVIDFIQGYRKSHKNLHLNEEDVLKNIAVLSPRTRIELEEMIFGLKKDLEKYPEVRLVIVDSLSHLIQFTPDSWQRTNSYFFILKSLRELLSMNIAIIVTNEMKNQIDNHGKNFNLVSSGGEITASQTHRRLLLSREKQNQFLARILKSPLRQMTSINFQITSNGIEDSS